jgi:hypothetical protein
MSDFHTCYKQSVAVLLDGARAIAAANAVLVTIPFGWDKVEAGEEVPDDVILATEAANFDKWCALNA